MNNPPKILIVDDEPFNVDYLEQELEDMHYASLSAPNGLVALERVEKDSPDLILLDIMMPGMDGFTVLSRLKANEARSDIPVIIISAMDDLASVVKGIELGAEDYLPKPFNPVLLRARLRNGLEKKRLRDEQKRLFRTFATSEVADELMAHGFSLGGDTVRATVMFTDIRNFTPLSESLTPQETISLLNRYYATMFEVTNAYHGTVSLIQGDGLMIIFGAPVTKPNHAELAVRAALEMLRRLAEFNEDRSVPDQVPIRIGIGIATGKMVAGYAGTWERAAYTCIGDTVNLAARLEAHTKVALKSILIDEFTKRELDDGFATEELGPVVYKGKSTPINTFAVIAN
jgi:class 3 adenylate cyclase